MNHLSSQIVIISLLISLVILIVLYLKANDKIRKKEKDIEDDNRIFNEYKARMEYLRKYEEIEDAELEAKKIIENANEYDNIAKEKSRLIIENAENFKKNIEEQLNRKIVEAKKKLNDELTNIRKKAKENKEASDELLKKSYEIASSIENNAKIKAKEIAGEAWEAKQNADSYKAISNAMKNIINGYGDEYLIPNATLLDELAEEYDHQEAGRDLAKIRLQIKSMIKNGEAADCDYVEPFRKKTAIEFILDAFNGKIDTIMSKVKHDNYGKLLKQIEDSYTIVNYNGKAFRNARIKSRYYDIIVEQLRIAVKVQELKKRDQEEQRRIKDEMREEERARREYERALRQAEKEEKLLQDAMKEAQSRLEKATAEERVKFEQELDDLKEKLRIAEEKGQRALSMAQQTKRGNVYIISNIGSFGDNIYKIGLTRRLEPLDRVRELGDASVPFSFDIHAMIYSENAPKLENELHKIFNQNQVNKVNPRKEFFKVNIRDIKEKVENLGYIVHWTMKSEAIEYRESLQLEKKIQAA